MTDIYVGIDPGKDGAVAFYVDKWFVYDCPLIETSRKRVRSKKTGKMTERVKKESSPVLMTKLFHDVAVAAGITDPRYNVTIERVSAMPTQGVTSMFSFGRNFGQWEGVIAAIGCTVNHVSPVRWKRAMLKDLPKGKETSRLRAIQLFPDLAGELSRKKDNGRAEAVLIGEYGRRIV